MATSHIPTDLKLPATRCQISQQHSTRRRPLERRSLFLPTLRTVARQPWCNFPAGISLTYIHSSAKTPHRDEKVCLMKIFATLMAALLLGLPGANAQSVVTAAPVNQDRTYQLLREDEDWSFLRDPTLRKDFWDPIKYIPLRKKAADWYVTLGGEAREVWEQIGNDNWGQSPFWNGYLNERYMPYVDLHYGPHVRTFIELKSGLNSFRFGGPRPIDEKKLDFEAAFLQLSASAGRNHIDFRVGRQELEYGSGRLIDVREGPNVRLSFDGFLLSAETDSWRVDGFAMRPDQDNPG